MSIWNEIGGALGAAAGTAVAPGVGTAIGAKLGSQVGGEAGKNSGGSSNSAAAQLQKKIDEAMNPGKAEAMKNYEAIIKQALEFSKNRNVPENIALTIYACNFSAWLTTNKDLIGNPLASFQFVAIPPEFASYLNADGVNYAKKKFLIPDNYSPAVSKAAEVITNSPVIIIIVFLALFFGLKNVFRF